MINNYTVFKDLHSAAELGAYEKLGEIRGLLDEIFSLVVIGECHTESIAGNHEEDMWTLKNLAEWMKQVLMLCIDEKVSFGRRHLKRVWH